MIDHATHKETVHPDGSIEHACPPCPHGRIKGYLLIPGPPHHQEAYHTLKRKHLDNLRCEDDHPGAPEVS
jgi:hypothetical protein